MRIPRVYQPSPLSLDTTIELDEWAVSHAITALRLKPGYIVHLFNGITAGDYKAELVFLSKRNYAARILEFIPIETESPLYTHLGQGISRGDRMDFALQKAVELGVNEITPLVSEHCSVHLDDAALINRMRHWKHILISATEQSGRCFVPTLNAPCDTSTFLSQNSSDMRVIFHPSPHALVQTLPDTVSRVRFLIGPEGGFSELEFEQACQAGYQSVAFGPRIVRTETATVVALSLLQAKWGDFKPILSL